MSTKEDVLELLEKNRSKSISGETIAEALNISRSAVWKSVKALQKDGYIIRAVPNLGYSLSADTNVLSVQGLLPYLKNENWTEKIYIYKSLESTNKTAKEMAINGCKHGSVIIADAQTAGKGRYNRPFYSPAKSGLYMSIVLRSEFISLPNITLITAAAAVAVCRAIKKVTGKETQIKWVNDILLDNKKVCGILTEAITDFETHNIDWIVLGIGININTGEFPQEIKSIAGSLVTAQVSGSIRNRLAAEIVNIILLSDGWYTENNVYDEYKTRMSILGKTIKVTENNKTYDAVAVDIDENGRLIIKKEDGTISHLSSGEVSLHL